MAEAEGDGGMSKLEEFIDCAFRQGNQSKLYYFPSVEAAIRFEVNLTKIYTGADFSHYLDFDGVGIA